MKIANCKCGAGKPSSFYYDGFIRIECPECGQEGYFKKTTTDAINDWNAQNTDQHGQQIKQQIIEWVEWDGDVEHLPKEGSGVHVLLNPSIVSGWIKLVTKENKVSAFIANNGLRGDIDLRKGDMFAVVEN